MYHLYLRMVRHAICFKFISILFYLNKILLFLHIVATSFNSFFFHSSLTFLSPKQIGTSLSPPHFIYATVLNFPPIILGFFFSLPFFFHSLLGALRPSSAVLRASSTKTMLYGVIADLAQLNLVNFICEF